MTKNHEAEIKDVLATYERSLNTADADLAASCYTEELNAPLRKLPRPYTTSGNETTGSAPLPRLCSPPCTAQIHVDGA
ncbi:MAG: nuclear transport factor 2 family protein [Acidimicrobiia bacterium]|nr:nuclear transport factor 2 family protein [Acidimicrobiia bacterium]